MNRGGAPLQQKARQQSHIRVRDMKRKKSKGLAGGSNLNYSSDGGTFPAINRGSERLAPLQGQKSAKKSNRENSAGRAGVGYQNQSLAL